MAASLVAALLLIAGCESDGAGSKTSLYEVDHSEPAHWPDDLADVSAKLRERLSLAEISANASKEIEDLVSWTAEVAADTDLSEADWMPLYHASDSLTANLRVVKGKPTPENRQQIESLCKLIDEATSKISASSLSQPAVN